MASLNRYKFTFGNKALTLTTNHDNLFMEEVERVAKEKYQAIKEQMPEADDETIAILLAVNSLSMQLNREIEFDDKEKELDDFRRKALDDLRINHLNKRRYMLTFLILLILAWSFYIGYARGIILQSYYFLVTLVALLICRW